MSDREVDMDAEMEADSASSDEEMESDDDLIREEDDGDGEVYIPGNTVDAEQHDVRPAKLVCDDSAYIMLHKAHTGAPCLSFDIIQDNLGDNRESYPMTNYLVCGTQAEKSHTNSVVVMKLSNMHRNKEPKEGEEEESEESDEEDEARKPVLSAALLKHPLGAVNRVRATQLGDKPYAASWCERGIVYIWGLSDPLHAVNDPKTLAEYHKKTQANPQPAQFSFNGHGVEGFAMDWSPLTSGNLLTGDCKKNIHLWKPLDGSWVVDQRPFVGHTASVEDIQWSPNEPTVFSSCSVDKSIRIWDIRAAPSKANMLTSADAHDSDVNVISWNRNEPFLVSGGDDGLIKIWDLRQFKIGLSSDVHQFGNLTHEIYCLKWGPYATS